MKTYLIDQNSAGQRIDRFLVKCFPNAGKGFLQKMLRKKNILLNGKKAEANTLLSDGDHVTVYFSDETIRKFSNELSEPKTNHSIKRMDFLDHPVFEDDHLMVVNKPVGLLAQPDASKNPALSDYLSLYIQSAGSTFHPAPLNRLDRNTSGIILIPKNYATQKKMAELIRERQIIKEYLALVSGTMETSRSLSHYLKKDKPQNQVLVADQADGQVARLFVKPIDHAQNTTLVKVRLQTGRSHQIRVQLAAEGFPIIGDPKYGNHQVNDTFRSRFGLNHQLLHSRRYEIPDSAYRFIAPPPEDMTNILKALGYPEVW